MAKIEVSGSRFGFSWAMIGGFGVKIWDLCGQDEAYGVKIWPPRSETWALGPLLRNLGSGLVALGSRKGWQHDAG